jgi:hypothetical protein
LRETVALGVLHLAAEEGRRELVSFVADHEVPATVGRLQFLLYVLVARELVEAGNNEVGFQEPIAGPRCFQLIVGQDIERQVESAIEFVLPLFSEASRADHEATLEVATGDQLLDQQAGHDGFARARIVSEQEAQRLTRQHAFVDRRDLVRQRLDDRGVYGEDRVEQMSEVNSLRLGHEAEKGAVSVEAPGASSLDNFEVRFPIAI